MGRRETASASSREEESAWSSTVEREAHRDEMHRSISPPMAAAAMGRRGSPEMAMGRRIWGDFLSFSKLSRGWRGLKCWFLTGGPI